MGKIINLFANDSIKGINLNKLLLLCLIGILIPWTNSAQTSLGIEKSQFKKLHFKEISTRFGIDDISKKIIKEFKTNRTLGHIALAITPVSFLWPGPSNVIIPGLGITVMILNNKRHLFQKLSDYTIYKEKKDSIITIANSSNEVQQKAIINRYKAFDTSLSILVKASIDTAKFTITYKEFKHLTYSEIKSKFGITTYTLSEIRKYKTARIVSYIILPITVAGILVTALSQPKSSGSSEGFDGLLIGAGYIAAGAMAIGIEFWAIKTGSKKHLYNLLSKAMNEH